jgi:hypothetical protein
LSVARNLEQMEGKDVALPCSTCSDGAVKRIMTRQNKCIRHVPSHTYESTMKTERNKMSEGNQYSNRHN